MTVSLVEMKEGQSGTIVHIQGGRGIAGKLYSLGLRPGKKVTKVSGLFHGGPVVVKVDGFQLAIGYGKALQIFVQVNGNGQVNANE
ncbi:MAG TPA: FeoA family protein [Bacillota bacterium]|jgi:ferrous iron transport protein A|nr:ferrous iron transport protein A [Bacillota bacterium]HOB86295.1 FeoA family protein [Bacillota bacterium]HOP70021.1 FeoA family protein [Bacillota bacterium]HPT34701.1 FeoA family protein [Bacillota bacterium]HQD06980.1 FeoA family protein [Bacillota bacterium]